MDGGQFSSGCHPGGLQHKTALWKKSRVASAHSCDLNPPSYGKIRALSPFPTIKGERGVREWPPLPLQGPRFCLKPRASGAGRAPRDARSRQRPSFPPFPPSLPSVPAPLRHLPRCPRVVAAAAPEAGPGPGSPLSHGGPANGRSLPPPAASREIRARAGRGRGAVWGG